MVKQADKNEILRVLDEKGDGTGKYMPRLELHAKDLYYANVAIGFINTSNKTVLLEHRSPNKIRNPGKGCLVGGHVVEDETPTLAAINEIKEEIGIRIKIENLRFLAVTGDKQYRGGTYHFYVLMKEPLKFIKIQKEELTEVKYMNYKDFKYLVKTNSETVSPKGEKYEKAFDLLDKVLEV